jgi:hypothetical protein
MEAWFARVFLSRAAIMRDNVINLRQARKQLARADAERQAQENRVRFGQTKAEKQSRKAEEARQRRQHEAGRLGDSDPGKSG